MPRWMKHLLGILGILTIAACSGSSSCSSCGMTPLPSGFPKTERIENAASVRVTQSGFNFLQSHVGDLAANLLGGSGAADGGVITFEIPESSTSGTGYDVTICPGGPDAAAGKCVAEIDIAHAQLTITTGAPHDILAFGPVPLRLKNLPIQGKALGVIPINVTAVASGHTNECDAASMTYKNVNVSIDISVEVERDTSHTSRIGYSKLRVVKMDISKDDITAGMHFCGGGLDDWLLNSLKGLIAGQLLGGLTDTLADTVNQQLCLKSDPAATPPCPDGSTDHNGICMYGDNSCVSMMLGMDGHLDLGSALSSFSPGTSGGLDILFAVGGAGARTDDPTQGWGDLNPIANGATLGLFGGALPQPVSNCVKPVPLDLPTGIPIPGELMGNALPGWQGEGPHVGVAVSERFLNHALKGAYNSGVLCIGVSTEQVTQLSTGLFSLLVPSIKYLTYQKAAAPIAVVVRPQKPPTITIGNGTDPHSDPLLNVKLDEAMIDFYAWSTDRFIRIFTAQFDLAIPVNLEVTADGLLPKLDKIFVNNPKVTNAELMKESPDAIAGALADVIEGLAGQFLGNLSPIDVSGSLASLGLTLNLQQAGIKKLSKGQDSFLGIFAAFGIAAPTTSMPIDTSIELVSKSTPPDGFRLATIAQSNRPSLTLRASSPQGYGSTAVEYAWKVDKGYWHAWTTDRDLIVDDAILRLQGRHDVFVKSRIVGQPATEDTTPAAVRVTIDVDAPVVKLTTDAQGVTHVEAWDLISADAALQVRHRFDDGAPSEWAPYEPSMGITWATNAKNLVVEVRDEEGNIASTSQALIRGRPDKSLSQGGSAACGCSVPGSSSGSGGLGAVAAACGALAMALRWRGRRRPFCGNRLRSVGSVVASAFVLAFGGSWTGCSCGDSNTSEPPPVDGPDAGGQDGSTQCGTEGNDPCTVLEPGLVGEYTSAAAAANGTIWISGYNEGDWENGSTYGDLVVGTWNASSKKVDWQSVDGVPSEPEPDPTTTDIEHSWRGGQDAAGDDVGMWTSLVLDGAGNPRVAYFDITNKALKFASYDGTAWSVSTVYKQADQEAGRYAKMLLIGDKPVIAFQVIEKGSAGFAVSRIKLAHAKSAVPKGSSDWDFEDVLVNAETPCRARLCKGSEVCVASTMQCAAKATGCSPSCASGTACVAGTCREIVDATKLDSYPEAIGDYIAIAKGPQDTIGMVFYDRIHGNLVQVRKDGGQWTDKILDGQSAGNPPTDTGDMGIGASLAIDAAGDWHVAYVDGFKESLRYMRVAGGTAPGAAEVVDDGLGLDSGPFDDGQHVVGDDSNIVVTNSGDIHIAYQDATAGTLRFASGTAGGTGHTWSRKVIAQDGFAGFFPVQVTANSTTLIVNWWRKGGAKIQGDVNVVAP
jgi:hypothetical protein